MNKYIFLSISIIILCACGESIFIKQEEEGYFETFNFSFNGEFYEKSGIARRTRDERDIKLYINNIRKADFPVGIDWLVNEYATSDTYKDVTDSSFFDLDDITCTLNLYGENMKGPYEPISGGMLILIDNNEYIEGEFDFVFIEKEDEHDTGQFIPDTIIIENGYFKITLSEFYLEY